jgi:stress-induced morphogen
MPLSPVGVAPVAPVAPAPNTEKQIAAKIQQGLQADSIRVQDTSGGCGAMYRWVDVRGSGTALWNQLSAAAVQAPPPPQPLVAGLLCCLPCVTLRSIEVVSSAFAGKSIVKQHQLVTQLLKDEIAQWHGFTLVTKPGAAA